MRPSRWGRRSWAGVALVLAAAFGIGLALGLRGDAEDAAAPAASATAPAPAPPAAGTTVEPPPATTAAPEPPPPEPPDGFAIWDVRVVELTPFSARIAWRTTKPSRSTLAYGLAGGGSTLWAPAGDVGNEHEATLPGLAHSTGYIASLEAVAGDERAAASVELQTPPLPASVTTSTGGGTVLIDGEPFFPLMVWGQCPRDYDENLAAGINLFAANGCGTLEQQLDELGGRALSAAVSGQPEPDPGSVIGWFYEDEPDLDGTTGDALPALPLEPGQVSFLTLSNHFYSGAAPLSYGRGMYPGLAARADVVGFDLYPLQNWCQENRLADVYEAQRELVALAPGKPTFQWIETSGMDCDFPPLRPTPETVRAEMWLAIAGGAHGLGIFPPTPSEEVAATLAQLVRQLKGLGPALLAPATPVAVEPAESPVRVGARAYNGALYVIAANPTREPVRATVQADGLDGRTLHVLDENRAVEADGDAFADDFAPLGVHVYLAPPPER